MALDGLSNVLVLVVKLLQSSGTGYDVVDSLSQSTIKPSDLWTTRSSKLKSKCVFINGSVSFFSVFFDV